MKESITLTDLDESKLIASIGRLIGPLAQKLLADHGSRASLTE